MRNVFRGHYRNTDEEFQALWEQADISFDANVLLSIYRYTPTTRDTLISLLNELQDRIWLPHQVGFEFHDRRHQVITDQDKTYNDLISAINKVTEIVTAAKHHPYIDYARVHALYGVTARTIERELTATKSQHEALLRTDEHLNRITELFDGRVGEPYDGKKYAELLVEGAKRYENRTPPGYEDKQKSGDKPYGDWIVWRQLMDHAVKVKKPIIFITDDNKSDWWLIHQGRTLGPRPELIAEIYSEANVDYYMYSSEQFIERASSFLDFKAQQAVLDEVREVQAQDDDAEDRSDYLWYMLRNRLRSLIQAAIKTKSVDDISVLLILDKANNRHTKTILEELDMDPAFAYWNNVRAALYELQALPSTEQRGKVKLLIDWVHGLLSDANVLP